MNRSQSEHTLLTFNCNSKDFTLGWDHGLSNSTTSFLKKNQFKDYNVNNRPAKFLEKKANDVIPKIGASEIKVITPTIPKKITRNDKEKSTFYVVGGATKFENPEKVQPKTERDILDLSLKFDEMRLTERKKKKDELTKLNEEKINKLFKKVKEREPFKF